MAAAAAADDAVAADIICSLRGADLAGWTPPWSKRARPMEGELSWPAVARGKRSRRRSPASSSATAAGKARCARSSPASPLDYSAGSASLRSGASTSGGEDGAFCSPWHRRAATAPATTTKATKVGSIRRPQLTFQAPPPRPAGQRQRKKLRLPEVQQLVRSLAVENESLHEEMRELQRACSALSKENDKLEIRIEQSNSRNEATLKEQKGKQQLDQQQQQSPHDSFALPDLNLPAQDGADGSVPC
ncbi:uncharacterized protein LOC119324378 [Triticum dicoccoides]|uniref:uncharacterized protein LOC119324378 n=1 Tax=Triticum dicoccoides TaxID=85692 RepID=UPI001890BB73|nr:uncharacterized protein LOC119324378 [Triticum dicoccoides]